MSRTSLFGRLLKPLAALHYQRFVEKHLRRLAEDKHGQENLSGGARGTTAV
jgi:hypothetical protein